MAKFIRPKMADENGYYPESHNSGFTFSGFTFSVFTFSGFTLCESGKFKIPVSHFLNKKILL